MRPQDIVILLKILLLEKVDWQYRDLALSLQISVSEISESLNRSHIAGLIGDSKRNVYRNNMMEFVQYGLHYVFPQSPGTMVIGTATAHSHHFFKEQFSSEVNYVWPDENGIMRGLSIEPLYKGAVKAAQQDEALYKALASIDILRVGQNREIKFAINELQKLIL